MRDTCQILFVEQYNIQLHSSHRQDVQTQMLLQQKHLLKLNLIRASRYRCERKNRCGWITILHLTNLTSNRKFCIFCRKCINLCQTSPPSSRHGLYKRIPPSNNVISVDTICSLLKISHLYSCVTVWMNVSCIVVRIPVELKIGCANVSGCGVSSFVDDDDNLNSLSPVLNFGLPRTFGLGL